MWLISRASAQLFWRAGPSTRMGRPKQLLQFCGQTLVRRAASVVVKAGCRPVVVVTGAHAVATREALSGLDVQEAENQQWPFEISSSIRAGSGTAGSKVMSGASANFATLAIRSRSVNFRLAIANDGGPQRGRIIASTMKRRMAQACLKWKT